MAGKLIRLRATRDWYRWAKGLLKALANIKGSGTVRVHLMPGVGLRIHGEPTYYGPAGSDEQLALAWIKAKGTTGEGWYTAEEIEPASTAGEWQAKSSGRKWGIDDEDSADLGEVFQPQLWPGLDPPTGVDGRPILLRRVNWLDHPSLWVIHSGDSERFALARLDEAGEGDGFYTADEVVPDTLGTWAVKSPGMTWGKSEGDEGELYHPHATTGLEPSSGDGDVYVVMRVGEAEWVIVSGGGGLPAGTGQYKGLYLDASDNWHVDYARFH